MRWTRGWVCLLLSASLGSACSRDIEAAKRQHFEAGNRYFDARKYSEAIVEYRNALQEDGNFGEARLKLGDAYAETREAAGALREYVRAADLLPENHAAQSKAATYLLIGGQFEDARTRIQRVLDTDPTNAEALIILGSALAGLRDMEGAVKQMEEAIRVEPERGLSYTNLAFLRLAQGGHEDARAAFIKAVALDPQSVPALLALANFYLSREESADAEHTLKRALQVEPGHLLANRALATLYMATGRPAEAEPFLKTIAAGQTTAEPRFALADYYMSMKRPADAKSILQPMAADKTTFAGAQPRLAEIEYAAGQIARAHAMLDEVLRQESASAAALMVKAAWLFREGKSAEALAPAAAAVKAEADSAPAHYLLGTIQAALHDSDAAIASFGEVLRLNPRMAVAQAHLSRLELERGNTTRAVELASSAVATAPASPAARVSLAQGLITERDIPRAQAAVSALLKDYPNAAATHALNGSLQLAKRDTPAARKAFERAMQLDPASFAAFSGLVSADMLEKKVPSARARIDARLRTSPETAELLRLAARVYIAANDGPAAERALRRVMDVAPADDTAYTMLAQLYLAQGQLDGARTEFDQIAQRKPKDVSARTMSAIIVHSQGNLDEARKRYEEILDIDAGAPVATNNLAWILAEKGEDLNRALRLAQKVQEQRPEAAEYNHTVGWVYLKKQLPSLAIASLERSIRANPSDPTTHYHLGMALAAAGDQQKARAALQKALALRSDFNGADQARELLSTLKS